MCVVTIRTARSSLGFIDHQFFGAALHDQGSADSTRPRGKSNGGENGRDPQRCAGDEEAEGGAMFIEEQFFGSLLEREKENK
jgi:hypothetical protein